MAKEFFAMYTSSFVKRTLSLVAFVLLLVTLGTTAPAQEGAQGADTTVAATGVAATGIPVTDSLAMTTNESVANAT